jgi:hypothetical protein
MLTICEILGKQKYIREDLVRKAKELGIKGYYKLTKDQLAERIVTEYYKLTKYKLAESIVTDRLCPQVKHKISKKQKNNAWNMHIGQEKGIGECSECWKEIDSKDFECVPKDSNDGNVIPEELIPVCSECYKSKVNTDIVKDKPIYFSVFLNEYNFFSNQPNIHNFYTKS